ncbi:GNAT family N-acetyltransferase [Mucilaginibacter ginkgonis]|uniref:GNAT family N-acetyltransferase n=1 Tax=Mucilaginibacter ginkgonis TaxID=2682091 RepID=A0A6I4HYI7_9SPHI|nr:GNAT family N-acetyltransferase [Mucilaginibacter ginkgonis]QQL51419.1 GNAT family N-acetyltransferase [Mucilaginibacter ginkgonis]
MENNNSFEELRHEGYSVTNNLSMIDTEAVYQFMINESYWAQGMPKEKFGIAINNSMVFGVIKEDITAGFARVITDKATFAYLCDVFIAKDYRGKGLGKFLINEIVNHPQLQGLRRWSLATRDAHGLYKQFGFAEISKPEIWMEKYKPYIEQGS